MLIFLSGPDSYRRIKKKNEIISTYSKKYSACGIGYFSLNNESCFFDLQEFVSGQSLFQPIKLAIVTDFFDFEKEKQLVDFLMSMLRDKNTTILLEAHSAPKKLFHFLLKEPVLFQEFPYLEGSAWRSFVLKEATARGLSFDSRAFEFILKNYTGNTFGLIRDLDNLSLLGVPVVTINHITSLCAPAPLVFFKTVTDLSHSNLSVRLEALSRLFYEGHDSAKIFNIFASLTKNKIPQCAGFDVLIKSGKIDYDEALLRLLL